MFGKPTHHTRLFVTFVEEDLPLVRSIMTRLRADGAITVDYSLTTERFDAPESVYVRASLAGRIKRSTATLCLLGGSTLENPWVSWSLQATRELDRLLLAVSLAGTPTDEGARTIEELGGVFIGPRPDDIVRALTGDDAVRHRTHAVSR